VVINGGFMPLEGKQLELPFVRSPYNYDRDAASNDAGLFCAEPTLAVQSSKEECDINTIVERFGLTGELPTDVRAPRYGDFVGVSDYHSAMNAVAKANEAFDAMPWQVRLRFHGDPEEFVNFVADPANESEARKLGLLVEKVAEVVPPQPAPVAAPAVAVAAGGSQPAPVAESPT
jgi:phage internal scaffolding protein